MIEYSYLRPLKAEALRKLHEPLEKKNDLKVPVYQNAAILPLRRVPGDSLLFGRGGVVDENKEYVESSAIPRRVQFAYEAPDAVYCDKKVVYCGYLVKQWGHFLIEAVARLWYFLKNDPTVDSYVFFLNEGETRSVAGSYKEFFVLLGVWDKLEFINKPTIYRSVVVPELGYSWRKYYSEQYVEMFRRISENAPVDPAWRPQEKIYFTRSQLKDIGKKEFGLDMLDNFFSRNGYRVVAPERTSLSETLFLMKNAKTVGTLSGSLAHNLLFTDEHKDVIILERNTWNNEIQADVNNIKNLNVVYIDANIPIYSINVGYGPFIMAFNDLLEKYAEDRQMVPPTKKYLTERYKRSVLRKYLKEYFSTYHYEWVMEDWEWSGIGYLREGYRAGVAWFSDYLTGERPLFPAHFFMPHYIKRLARRVCKKLMR